MKYAFNGRFLMKKVTGQERYAAEIISSIDKICKKGEFCVITSELVENIPNYNNIEVIKTGRLKREAWEQFCLGPYLRKHHLKCINLTTTFPLFHPNVVSLYDMSVFEIGRMFSHTFYGFLGTIYKRLLFRIAARKAEIIVTISKYSRDKLMDILNIPSERIHLIYPAWQHFEQVSPDNSIIQRLELTNKTYYFSLSSLTPQKNFIWIKEVAERNPDVLFVVTGKAEGFTRLGINELSNKNIMFTGYLSDNEIKSLMQHCKAFIHPAIYEGFGIPPIEAMSSGAQLILSTSTCLPEIYENSAHYIDPYNYDVDLDKLMSEPVEPALKVLEKFSWDREAAKFYEILKK
jgi:glycosyltransferase involved in cell wall biosynthesis